MGILITSADFTGKYAIPQDSFSNLDGIIAAYEETYLIDLLGVDLYNLFVADLSSKIPVTAKYLTIYNPFNNDYGSTVKRSIGMKKMILGFIFFEYMRELKFKNTISGVNVQASELNRETDGTTLFKNYNESVNTFTTIQWKIRQNPADYLDYNGQCKKIANPFF